MKPLSLLLISAAVLGFTGCSTVDSRIREKSAVFASLDPQTQTRLKESVIKIGDTTDMVYIALGRPEETREKTTAQDRTTSWIYKNYWQEYEGTRVVGYRRHAYVSGGAWHIYYEPIRQDLYRDRIEDRTRITFKDGKVTVVEQAKD